MSHVFRIGLLTGIPLPVLLPHSPAVASITAAEIGVLVWTSEVLALANDPHAPPIGPAPHTDHKRLIRGPEENQICKNSYASLITLPAS